jgi:hypothetical protein
MFLNAVVISGNVPEGAFFDQLTGVKRLSHNVELTVLDANTDEKYVCQFSSGFQCLEDLKQMRLEGASDEELRERVEQAKAGELPARFTQLQLEVLKYKGKQAAFIKLVCRFVQVADQVAA